MERNLFFEFFLKTFYITPLLSLRIMKPRKTYEHSKLVAEAIEQLKSRFPPKIPMIKKGIDTLIEKEYLERDANDRQTLKYLA